MAIAMLTAPNTIDDRTKAFLQRAFDKCGAGAVGISHTAVRGKSDRYLPLATNLSPRPSIDLDICLLGRASNVTDNTKIAPVGENAMGAGFVTGRRRYNRLFGSDGNRYAGGHRKRAEAKKYPGRNFIGRHVACPAFDQQSSLDRTLTRSNPEMKPSDTVLSTTRNERAQRSPFMADVQADIDAEDGKLTRRVQNLLLVLIAIALLCAMGLAALALERLFA